MKPPPFQYYDPSTVADAVGLLARLENAKVLAGGQSLMPMLNMRYVLPDHIIDINKIAALSYLREENGALVTGAMTRQRDLEFSDAVKARYPLLHEAIMNVGHRQTRNRGTVGGSLCHLDPSAEIPTVAAAVDATVSVTGPKGNRDIAFAACVSQPGPRGTATALSNSRAGTAILPSPRRRRCSRKTPTERSSARP